MGSRWWPCIGIPHILQWGFLRGGVISSSLTVTEVAAATAIIEYLQKTFTIYHSSQARQARLGAMCEGGKFFSCSPSRLAVPLSSFYTPRRYEDTGLWPFQEQKLRSAQKQQTKPFVLQKATWKAIGPKIRSDVKRPSTLQTSVSRKVCHMGSRSLNKAATRQLPSRRIARRSLRPAASYRLTAIGNRLMYEDSTLKRSRHQEALH